MKRRGRHAAAWTCALVLLGTGACREPAEQSLVIKSTDEDPEAWWATPDSDDPVASDDDPDPISYVEVCDGFDNDLDGLTDEDFVSVSCSMGGDDGVLVCKNGRVLCHQCDPGETREADCGCGIARHDRCNDVGRWLFGACSGCEEQAPVGCASAIACEPGDRRTQRCDTCTPGVNCGPACLGTEVVCNDNCEWAPQASCLPVNAECDRDEERYEPCGRCGVRKVTCDGCYYQYEACEDEGVCSPGESFAAPCGGQSCAQGHYSTIRCSDQCMWVQSECAGCDMTAAPHVVTTECVPGADCGERVVQESCAAAGSSEDCSGGQLPRGEIQTVVLRDDCVTLECIAGESRDVGCTTGLGQCGTQTQICSNTCDWPLAGGVCTARPDSCIPGTQTSEPVSCGANACGATFTRTSTCQSNGCGWSSQDGAGCPVCNVGDTGARGCTTIEGRCGTETRACTGSCDWGTWQGCVANAGSCVPGTQSRTPLSCGPNSCGATYDQVSTCNGAGCGFSITYEGSCPTCAQGQQETADCTTGDGRCGIQTRTCSGVCDWGGWSACVPRADSCLPGQQTSTPISCGGGLCGATINQVSTCNANGCGWSTSTSGSCPQCSAGQTEQGDCTTASGACGTQSRTCSGTCDWGGWSGCAPRPDACTPNAIQSRSCTWACGLPGSQTAICNGCGWDVVGECVPLDSAACSPGDSEVIGPCANCPTQTQTRSCDASCHWVTSTCRACL
ncbi:MAG: hypothetical protein ACAI38_21695 [Myxococcota bacterium]